ncbi:MAG TPA: hypothetical protein P5083_00365 [Candidatus Paceibacterota bacterium]|nr:hypothetical protein [Candidatus Paceibacterota bacterium]
MNLKTFKNFLFCLSFLGILIVNGNVLATPDLPDLVVTNIFNNCSYNTIGVTVCNQGSNTNNMFRIAIKSNNHSMASGFVSISINNPCITYSFFSSSLGININDSYTATATADPLTGGIDMVKESDENNNTLTKIVQGCSSALSSVNAQCGSANGQSFNSAPTTNLCAQGTATPLLGTGPWTWTCNGLNGGANVNCSAEKTSTSTACTWTCGDWSACVNGTQTRTCTSSPSGCTGDNLYPTSQSCTVNVPVNAQCGSANGQSFNSAPTTNLCAQGTATPLLGTGPWTWTCNGLNGGANVNCSAEKTSTSTACTWTCGDWSACVNGTQTRTCTSSPSGCTGDNLYPTSQSCTVNVPVNAQCGSANGQSFNSAPTTNLCAQGTESQIINNSEYNLWLWICNGSNDGGRVGCYAYKKINAQCGDANGYSFESMPTSKLCLSGTAGPIIDSGFSSWLWICYGPNFGINVGCYAYKKEPIRKFNNLSKF